MWARLVSDSNSSLQGICSLLRISTLESWGHTLVNAESKGSEEDGFQFLASPRTLSREADRSCIMEGYE